METVTWTTLEFEPKERHHDWNWYTGLVAGIAAAIAFFYGDTFFGVFAIIAGIIVIIYAALPPKHLTIVINKDSVSVNGEITPFNAIKQFWLDETDKQDKLLLLVQGSFIPMLSIPLQDISAETVRQALKPHTTEIEMHQSRSVKFFDNLGF